MPRFSLVIATRNRTEELQRLLHSLAAQGRTDVEIFVVDQNEDDRLVPIMAAFPHPELMTRLHAAPGNSAAKNKAIPLCTGDILTFPDDDCWYPEGVMDFVEGWFRQNPEDGVLSLTQRDEKGNRSANQWNSDLCALTPLNIFRTTSMSTVFVRRSACPPDAFFDEQLGPGSGTPFASGEDTDYVLMLLKRGMRGKFTQLRYVGHPMRQRTNDLQAAKRATIYGLGMGRVLSKYRLRLLFASLFVHGAVRAGLNVLKGDALEASFRWNHAKGIVRGYLA